MADPVGDLKEYYVGDRGPLLFDNGLDYLDAAGNPTGVLMRGARFPNVYLDLAPAEDHEAVPRSYVTAGFVPTSRLVSTTLPLQGGGDLTADRTLVLAGLALTGAGGIGGTNQLVGVTTDESTWEYKDLLGTANQISVTHTPNEITLATSQDIHTGAAPTFDDLTLSTPVNIYALSHDSFAGFVGNEHMDTTAWAAHLIPSQDVTTDLGSSSYQWAELYVNHIYASGNAIFDGGDIGITSDTDLIQMAANLLTINGAVDVSGGAGLSIATSGVNKVLLETVANTLKIIPQTANTNMIFSVYGSGTKRGLIRVYHTDDTNYIQIDPGTWCIGITADTDLLQLASGALTVNGTVLSTGNVTISNTAPELILEDTTGAADEFGIRNNDNKLFLRNITDSQNMITLWDDSGTYKVGILTDTPAEALDVNGILKAGGYKSSDGSAGISQTINITEDGGAFVHVLTFKNGILTVYLQA